MANLYQAHSKTIFEGKEKAVIAAITREVMIYKASDLRMEAICDKAIYAGANMLKNSVSINRLNCLPIALNDAKETRKLPLLARVPEYLELQGAIYFDKTAKVFVIADYAALRAACANMQIPTTHYFAWLKANPAKSEKPAMTEAQCVQQLTNLVKAMRKSPHIQASGLTEIQHAIQDTLLEYGINFAGLDELERMREVINAQ